MLSRKEIHSTKPIFLQLFTYALLNPKIHSEKEILLFTFTSTRWKYGSTAEVGFKHSTCNLFIQACAESEKGSNFSSTSQNHCSKVVWGWIDDIMSWINFKLYTVCPCVCGYMWCGALLQEIKYFTSQRVFFMGFFSKCAFVI